MLNKTLIEHLLWIPLLLFASSQLPQIKKNFDLQSTRGLSLFHIYMFFAGLCFCTVYAHLLNLPFPYRIMLPLNLFFRSLIGFQAYFYAISTSIKLQIALIHIIVLLLSFLLLLIGQEQPYLIGNMAGWCGIMLLALNQIPQIFKIWKSQSVEGYSITHVRLSLGAVVLELIIALLLHLPPQNIINNLRNIFLRILQLYQFWRYKKER